MSEFGQIVNAVIGSDVFKYGMVTLAIMYGAYKVLFTMPFFRKKRKKK